MPWELFLPLSRPLLTKNACPTIVVWAVDVLLVLKRYAAKAEPASTISNAAASAIENHLGRLFCPGAAGVGDGTVCLGACDGTEGPVGVVGRGVLAETARGACVIGSVGIYLSSGVCIAGADPVGVVTGKKGVEDEMTGDGGRAGVLLPATTGGTDGVFDSGCCGRWLGYVGLFIVSREPLIPLGDGGLTVKSDGRA